MPASTLLHSIEKWLNNMGLHTVDYPRPDILRVDLIIPRTRKGFQVYFQCNNIDVKFESPVFKAVSGEDAQVRDFNDKLLLFNNNTHPLYFSLVPVRNKEFKLALIGAQQRNHFEPYYLDRVMGTYKEFYTNYFEDLKDMAIEQGLRFDGKGDGGSLGGLWSRLMGRDT